MIPEAEKLRVVIYARVSTEHEAQIYALENQLKWYEQILSQKPEWNLVGQYIDEGLTGTSTKKQAQFLKMIEDARRHKFDLIITREVSRFARNTIDTLQYISAFNYIFGCMCFQVWTTALCTKQIQHKQSRKEKKQNRFPFRNRKEFVHNSVQKIHNHG